MWFSVICNRILTKLKFLIKNVMYIGGNDALPPPLTKEEESDLVNKLMHGNESVRSILIERNLISALLIQHFGNGQEIIYTLH